MDDWFEDVFSSAEIEELTWRGQRVLANTSQPIKVELYFDHKKAEEFIEANRRRSAGAIRDLLGFCYYLSQVVEAKLEDARDGTHD